MSKDGVALNELTLYSFDQGKNHENLARMIILRKIPFTIVEHSTFQMFVRNFRSKFYIFSRRTLASDFFKAYERRKKTR